MRGRKLRACAAVLCIMAALAGCGGQSSSLATDSGYRTGSYTPETRGDASARAEQMMAYSYRASIEIMEDGQGIDAAFEAAMDKAYELGGYLADKSASYYASGGGSMDFTVEIPAENAEAFAAHLKEMGNMTSFSQHIRNRTEEYGRAEQEGDAERMEEIRDDVAYSDFSIDMRTVGRYTDTEPTFWNQVGHGFMDAFGEFTGFVAEYFTQFIFFVLRALLIGIPCAVILAFLNTLYHAARRSMADKRDRKYRDGTMAAAGGPLLRGKPYIMYIVDGDAPGQLAGAMGSQAQAMAEGHKEDLKDGPEKEKAGSKPGEA